ncbi:MAG: hypothetical protein C0595_02110 [Marinilabiliales bacterium]|nr:MAG: hypothetical protein C0595_02110 [Marinilabiliales bacterium]
MKTRFILVILVISFLSGICYAQTSSVPSPKMNRKMYKQFIDLHLTYPEASKKAGIEGLVKIEFTTDTEGSVKSKKIIKPVSDEIDKEAMRIFNLIEWNPAFDYGIPKAGSGEFELQFKIKKYDKLVKRRGYTTLESQYKSDTSYNIYNAKQLDTIAIPILNNEETNLYKYIYQQMQYPKQAVELGIEGKVVINFIIETNGLPSNIIVEQNVGGGCTEEALRLVSELRWIPAVKNNLAVRSKKTLFIEFRLGIDGSGNYIPNQTNPGF